MSNLKSGFIGIIRVGSYEISKLLKSVYLHTVFTITSVNTPSPIYHASSTDNSDI